MPPPHASPRDSVGQSPQAPQAKEQPIHRRLDIVVAVLIDRAVAVEDDEFGLHGWASTLRSECRQIGHAVHGFMQLLQHALAVQTQIHLFGVDHDVVKERIHGRTQSGQGLQ